MLRRRFLQTSLLGVAALHWLGCAGPRALATQDELVTPDGDTPLGRAKAAGKPLLVLLVPESKEAREYRGGAYGFFLSEGLDKDVALLGLCEVACATRETLSKLVPEVTEEDWMVLLETDGKRPPHRVVRPAAAQLRGAYSQYADYPLAALAELFRGALFAEEDLQERRAAQCQRALSKAQQEAVAAYLKAPSQQPLALFDRGAALLLRAYEQRPPQEEPTYPSSISPFSHQTAAEKRELGLKTLEGDPGAFTAPERLVLLVASAASARLLRTPPEGSKWETLSLDGCPPCGMGNIPRISRQFLQFLTEQPEAI